MTRRLGLVLLLAIAGACSPRNVTRMSRNLVGGMQPIRGDLSLNIEMTGQGADAHYDLFVRWQSNFRLDLKAGESLVITADGRRFPFVAADGIRHDMNCDAGPCVYDDRGYYPASPADLRAIADAERVVVVVMGNKDEVEREFNELNFEKFRSFVDQHVPGSRASRPA